MGNGAFSSFGNISKYYSDAQAMQGYQVNGNNIAQSGVGQAVGMGGNFMKGIGGFGGALQGLSGLMGIYNGYQANKTAKSQLAFNKEAFNRNTANQAKTLNNSLRSRYQAALDARIGTGFKMDSMDDHMAQYQVDGSKVG